MTITEAGRLLRLRRISAAELLEECLRRIASQNAALNAFITVMEDSARRSAALADAELAQGKDHGPLHGIPVALKDLIFTRGVRTTAGSKIFAGFVPDRDAAVVERLTAAGAVIVGKANLHELAYGITSENPHYGAVRNPAAQERMAGGSSGGSAVAVASGMALAALGTDTGGSIRIPASFCGCVGLKPTFGRVSLRGVFPLGPTMDHVGPMAATVRDAALVLSEIAGCDEADPSSSRMPVSDYAVSAQLKLEGLRLGVPANAFRAAPEVLAAVERAAGLMEAAGARGVAVRLPDFEPLNAVGRVLLLVEAAAVHGRHLARRDLLGADVARLLDQGRLIPEADYAGAQRHRRALQNEFNRVWDAVDVLILPCTPTTAPLLGTKELEVAGEREDVRPATTRFTRPFDVLGLPAISLPCGRDSRRLPLAVQLVAPAFEEARLLRAAAALEDAQ